MRLGVLFIIVLLNKNCFAQDWQYYSSFTHNIPDDHVNTIWIDDDNNKWFGTNTGLACYNGEEWFTFSIQNKINEITSNPTSLKTELWLSTDNGIISIKIIAVDSIEILNTYNSGNSDIISNLNRTLNFDNSGIPWIGTVSGLSLFLGESWLNLTKDDPKLPNNVIRDIRKRQDGFNYLASDSGVARLKYDEVDGITSASHIDSSWSGLPSNSIKTLFFNKADEAWYGTKFGLSKHIGSNTKRNWITFTASDGLIDNSILFITEDKNSNIWVGTANGVSVFTGDFWNSWDTKGHSAGDSVFAISEDSTGTIWLCTDIGILSFNPIISSLEEPDNNTISGYNLHSYPNPFNSKAIIKYTLSKREYVQLSLFNVLGIEVANLVDEVKTPGKYKAFFDASNLPSGIYFYRLCSGPNKLVKRILLIK